MKKQNLRSEAAIKRWLELPDERRLVRQPTEEFPSIIPLCDFNRGLGRAVLFAEIDLRELVKKRKPLTGFKKQVSAIISGKKAKKGKK